MLAELVQTKTKDGLTLEGLFFESKKRKAIVIWLGGLTSRLPDHVKRTQILAETLNSLGVSFGIFEHRGSGIANIFKKEKNNKVGYTLAGSAYEKFTDSSLDIESFINFSKTRGYKKIFLLGHSTGANKLAYCIYKKQGRGLAGIGLLGPLSDVPDFKKSLGSKYQTTLKLAKKMVNNGRGDNLIPILEKKGKLWSAQRLVSIATELGKEDTFPTYKQSPKFYWVKKIATPLLVLVGSRDQYADLPIPKLFARFKKEIPTNWFSGKIISGADHSFNKREKELAQEIAAWIKKII